MIRQFSYSFNELSVNQDNISRLIGYAEGIIPEPFSGYITDAFVDIQRVKEIRGAIYVSDQFRFSENKDAIIIKNVEFLIGKTIAKELRNSSSVALFICTAGKTISENSKSLMIGGDPVLGYIYDVLGSVTVEAAMDKIHDEIKKMAANNGELITNRYSPGYCQWNVEDQYKLFSFFPENCCEISLNDSALMNPIKSVSGIIGFGKEVKYRKHTCDLCSLLDCNYRLIHKEK